MPVKNQQYYLQILERQSSYRLEDCSTFKYSFISNTLLFDNLLQEKQSFIIKV